MHWILGQKKVILLPEIGRVKNFLSFIRPHSRICIGIYIFIFKKQTNKQKKKNKTEIQIKQKILKNKREYIRKMDYKKICGRLGEDFSRHSHFRKQEHFLWPYAYQKFRCLALPGTW